MNVLDKAIDNACEMVKEYRDKIIADLIYGDASDDLYNDYDNGDCYHHENNIDRAYSLQEAAELLDVLSEHEDTDKGLWEGLEPRDAIETLAAYTFGNAVMFYWCEFIAKLNDEADELRIHYSWEERPAELEFMFDEIVTTK